MSVEKEPQLVFGYFISEKDFDKLDGAGYVDQDAFSDLIDDGVPGNMPAMRDVICQETDFGVTIGVVLCEDPEEGEAEFVDMGRLKKVVDNKDLATGLKDLVNTVFYGGTLTDLPGLFMWIWIS